MLLELTIKNVAIIEEVSINLKQGLTVFTGETGAGKSILIGSLMLALGSRATYEMVRTGEDEAEVNARFSLDEGGALAGRLKDAGIPIEEELLLRRVVTAGGRSRAYINDRPVTVTLLREVGGELVEISGQHEHQQLMQPRYHLDLLDLHGSLFEERAKIEVQYEKVRDVRDQRKELGGNALERARRKEYLNYQLEELDSVDLSIDEEEWEEERRYLLQLEKMIEVSQGSEEALYSGNGSITELLGRLGSQLSGWLEFSEELKAAHDGLFEAQAVIDDAARSLRNFASSAEMNPARLEEIEQQLSLLRDLKRKHGVVSVEDLAQTEQEYREELARLEEQEAQLAELDASFDAEVDLLRKLAKKLSKQRRKVAKALAKEIEKELASVGMKKARFVVDFQRSFEDTAPLGETDDLPQEEDEILDETERLPGPTGEDQVQFLLSSNPGEEPRSLQRVASGGELSRIMLSLKQILTEREPVDTCVFDEVDSGVGGFAATAVGQKIKKIASERQVICITHLPQLACYADHHFHIQKQEKKGRTRSSIQRLTAKQREKELARMLGGVEITSQSRAHARELLSQAKEFLAQGAA